MHGLIFNSNTKSLEPFFSINKSSSSFPFQFVFNLLKISLCISLNLCSEVISI